MGDIYSESYEFDEENSETGEVISERYEFDDMTIEVQIENAPTENTQTSEQADATVVPTVVPSGGESPAMAMGNGYQMFSQSMCLLAQNAVNAQQQLTMSQQTATTQELQKVIQTQILPSTLNSYESLDQLQNIMAVLTSLKQ
ncbi:MAG: RebB family R body protein [Crocosphaera sp.]|nr:RebB family R body protein [Crocosphaera sp.]